MIGKSRKNETMLSMLKNQKVDAAEQKDISADVADERPNDILAHEDLIDTEPPEMIIRDPQPRKGGIGLALGGGAARGWAHIGVLRAFDDAGIPVKMIAGTSIGALVGGCYLAGKLDDLEEFACSISRSNMLRFMDFAFRSSGLISGERLAKRMGPHLADIKIEELGRDFVAVATDIQTGHEIWLQDGPIIPAMRSSYALPGIFQPVWHNNRLLVDGALVNPVPVSACRASEPDVVIAINLNAEMFGKGTVIRSSYYDGSKQAQPEFGHDPNPINEAVQGWFSFLSSQKPTFDPVAPNMTLNRKKIGITGVMVEAFNIIQDRISRSRLAGDPPDYTIRPKLKSIGMSEFHRADEIIKLGYEEGQRRLEELLQHADVLHAIGKSEKA